MVRGIIQPYKSVIEVEAPLEILGPGADGIRTQVGRLMEKQAARMIAAGINTKALPES